jgi:hypothetical protein
METLTKGQKQIFKQNCTQLIDWIKLYGLPSSESCFITEYSMAARLRWIKLRPELHEEAKQIDTENILKLKNSKP